MANSIAKLAIAGATALTLALGSTGSANAWGGHWGGGHWGGGWGGWGVGAGILGGLALGTALSAPYWGGYGYAPYAYGGYAPYAYGGYAPYAEYEYGGYAPYAGYGGSYAASYGSECYIRRRVVIDRFGYRHVRRVQVCN